MAPIRSGSLPRVAAVAPTQGSGAPKRLDPSATALAKTLDWHQQYSSPARVTEYHAAFQAALGSDQLRADFKAAIADNHPALAQAVETPVGGGGWIPGAKASPASADLPTDVAANALREELIRQRRRHQVSPEDVKASYDTFRKALANDPLRARMDQYLVTCDRPLARELGVVP